MSDDQDKGQVLDLTARILAGIREDLAEIRDATRANGAAIAETNLRVAENSNHIRVLATVIESGFRELSRALDTRADIRRVEELEHRVERLELHVAGAR